jgi:endonuclease/exonuclease/phosphatase family metal-dependent hydrolase
VILSRLNVPPFPFVATLHLTTLVGERQPDAPQGRMVQAQRLRAQQVEVFLDLVKQPVLEMKQPMILAGDFNAEMDEDCIQQLLEAGFTRLEPNNAGPSHGGSGRMIDHILFFPGERLLEYDCYIEDSDLSKRASDHLPVVADMRIE